jgi:flavin-dependent dehydrogenase
MLIRLIIGPADEHRSGANQMRQHFSFREHFRRGNAAAGWLAAGDASISFDPLSAQGLLHALFSGLAAAEVAHFCLAGDDDAVPRYTRLMNSIHQAYQRRLDFYYASETRWPSAPFWQRRRGLH